MAASTLSTLLDVRDALEQAADSLASIDPSEDVDGAYRDTLADVQLIRQTVAGLLERERRERERDSTPESD